MEDMPPAFATQAPTVFDNHLPKITVKDVEQLRTKFPDLAKSLQLPEGEALNNFLAKSMMSRSLTAKEGETYYLLQNMPKKIQLNAEHDIASVSVMHKFANGEGRSRKSAFRGARSYDSDSDDEMESAGNRERRSRNGNRKGTKNKMTKSLPMDDSCFLRSISKNEDDKNDKESEETIQNIMTESTEFTVDKTVDPSCSSADPSSSSAVNTSVAPSSSSDGSVMKNAGSGISQQLGLNSSNSNQEDQEKKMREMELLFSKLNEGIKAVQKGSEISSLKEDLSDLKQWIVQEKNEKVVVLSQWKSMLTKIMNEL